MVPLSESAEEEFVSRDVKRSNLPIVKYVNSVLWQCLQPALQSLVFSLAAASSMRSSKQTLIASRGSPLEYE